MNNIKSLPLWGKIVGVVVILAVVILVWGVKTNISVTNDLNVKQNTLSAAASDTLQELSNCTQKTLQSIQVAGASGGAVKDAVESIVKARNPVGADSTKTAFVSALTENGYDGTAEKIQELYKLAVTTANGCQDDFTGSQQILREQVRLFENARNGSWTARMFASEFPTDELEYAISADNIVTGKAALRKMKALIKTGSTEQAATTGTVPEANLFPTTTVG